jgi:sulfate/thiosulfate transport system permease protein
VRRLSRRGSLPGFGLSLGITLAFVSAIVLIPLSMAFLKAASMGPAQFWATVTTPRALAAYRLTFSASALAALFDTLFGVLVAWVLVRYRFPGHKILDALIDLPFAIPTAVGGIALTALFAPHGWLGQYVPLAFKPSGVIIALMFVSLPFVVRTVQPVLEQITPEVEESAAVLGASRLQIFIFVLLPEILPSALTGFALAFGRAIGEYGSVVFISGNMPMKTEIASLLIMTKLEQFDYAGATAIAVVMLSASFLLLFGINRLQAWTRTRTGLT